MQMRKGGENLDVKVTLFTKEEVKMCIRDCQDMNRTVPQKAISSC